MNTDWKALCAELLNAYSVCIDRYMTASADQDDLVQRARIALAQPEPVGPTDNELLRCMIEAADSVPGGQSTGIIDWEEEALAAARAVLARFGRPAIAPIPVSERLPGADDCDAEGRLYAVYNGRWFQIDLSCIVEGGFTHWLPAHALPLPGQPAPAAPAP